MTKTQIEVITTVERRRRWPRVEKERIVAAAMEPGAVASVVAREAGIHASQLYRWRRQLCDQAPAATGFAAVTIAAEPSLAQRAIATSPSGLIEIELASGARLRISGAVDAATVSVVIAGLAGRRR